MLIVLFQVKPFLFICIFCFSLSVYYAVSAVCRLLYIFVAAATASGLGLPQSTHTRVNVACAFILYIELKDVYFYYHLLIRLMGFPFCLIGNYFNIFINFEYIGIYRFFWQMDFFLNILFTNIVCELF